VATIKEVFLLRYLDHVRAKAPAPAPARTASNGGPVPMLPAPGRDGDERPAQLRRGDSDERPAQLRRGDSARGLRRRRRCDR